MVLVAPCVLTWRSALPHKRPSQGLARALSLWAWGCQPPDEAAQQQQGAAWDCLFPPHETETGEGTYSSSTGCAASSSASGFEGAPPRHCLMDSSCTPALEALFDGAARQFAVELRDAAGSGGVPGRLAGPKQPLSPAAAQPWLGLLRAAAALFEAAAMAMLRLALPVFWPLVVLALRQVVRRRRQVAASGIGWRFEESSCRLLPRLD